MTSGPDTLSLTGILTEKDQRTLINAAQGGSIGPTTLYYAGVTAPIIGAGMAVIGRASLIEAGLYHDYWLTLFSAILAAMAGIVWYLIFVRWSKSDLNKILISETYEKEIVLDASHITLKRNAVETRIALSDIEKVTYKDGNILIRFASASPIFVPAHWFEDKDELKQSVVDTLNQQVTA